MKLKKLFILIILIFILCISSVSASEDTVLNLDDADSLTDSVSASEDTVLNLDDADSLTDSVGADVDGVSLDGSVGADVDEVSSDDNIEYVIESKNVLSSSGDCDILFLNTNSNLLYKSNEATVKVIPSAKTYKYGSDVRLTVNLTGIDGIVLDGIVILTIDNKQYLANVTGGSSNVIISGLENNTYSVFAEFLGNDLYEPSINDEATFTVNKSKKVTGDVAVNDIVYGQSVTISVENLTDVDGVGVSVFGGYQLVGPKTPYGSFSVRRGKGSFTVSDLPAGNYSAYIVFGNNIGGSYEFEYLIANFTVNKTDPTLNAITNNIVFGETAAVNISVNGVKNEKLNETLLIMINGENYGTIDSVNGIANLELFDLEVGNYTVEVWFRGLNSTNYNLAEYSCLFNVNKAVPTLTVVGSTVEWGNPSTVEVRVLGKDEKPISGTVIVQVDLGDNVLYDLLEINEEGIGESIFRVDALGECCVTATFISDERYDSTNATDSIIITEPRQAYIELDAEEKYYGESSSISVIIKDARGAVIPATKLNITVDDKTTEFDVIDGKVDLGKLNAGSTLIKVSFDDGFHQLIQDELEIKVFPSPYAELYIKEIDGKLIIKPKDGNVSLDGIAIVFIDDSRGIVVSINEIGIGELDISNLSPGNHLITARFSNDNYEEVSQSITLAVPKYANATVSIVANQIKEGEAAIIDLSVKDGEIGLSGLLILTIDDCDYAVNITEGVGSANIKNLVANEYPIIAKFQGNDFYEEAMGESTLAVSIYRPANIDISLRDNEIIVNITDSQGDPIKGSVSIAIDGNVLEYPIGEDGTVSIDSIEEGEHNVSVYFQGSDSVAPTNSSKVIFIPKANPKETIITVVAANISFGEKAVIEFNLTDISGNSLDASLNVTVGNEIKTVDVVNGTGLLDIDGLNADTYPIIANYGGNETFSSSVGFGQFNVAKNATKIIFENMETIAVDYYNDGRVGEFFKWRLVDANGNPIANTPMQIGFNGVVYDEKDGIVTDAEGYAQLQINLARKDLYTFAVCWLGDENHNGSFVVAKITVDTQTPTIAVSNKSYKATASTKTLTATFKSNRGTVIANKKITFTVNGKTYSAKTNDKGVASVNVSITKKGSYAVTAKFAGDSIYSAVTKKATLKLT